MTQTKQPLSAGVTGVSHCLSDFPRKRQSPWVIHQFPWGHRACPGCGPAAPARRYGVLRQIRIRAGKRRETQSASLLPCSVAQSPGFCPGASSDYLLCLFSQKGVKPGPDLTPTFPRCGRPIGGTPGRAPRAWHKAFVHLSTSKFILGVENQITFSS